MMLAARGAFLAARRKPRLPYDAEVEYLQSTGDTTYMLLPLVWSDTTHVEVTWQRINMDGQWLFGCRNSINNSPYVGLYHERNNDNLSRARFQNYIHTTYGGWWSGAAIQQRKETVIIDYQSLTMTYSLGTKTISAFEAAYRNNTTALFGMGNSAGTGLYGSSAVRIYSFKASDATGDLCDLQPVRFVNEQGVSEGAMYDRVSGQLFRNAGTGAFVIGPDKTA